MQINPSTDYADYTDYAGDAFTRLQRPAAAFGRAEVNRGPEMSFMFAAYSSPDLD